MNFIIKYFQQTKVALTLTSK